MAKKNIEAALRPILDSKGPGKAAEKIRNKLKSKLGGAFQHSVSFTQSAYAKGMKSGMDIVLRSHAPKMTSKVEAYNTESLWSNALKTAYAVVGPKLESANITTTKEEDGSYSFVLITDGTASNKSFKKALADLRNQTIKSWKEQNQIQSLISQLEKEIEKGKLGKGETGESRISQITGGQKGTQFVHDAQNTDPIASTAKAFEQDLDEETYALFTKIGYKKENLVDKVLSGLELSWEIKTKKVNNRPVQYRVVKGQIGVKNERELTDWGKRAKKKGGGNIIDDIMKALEEELADIKGLTKKKDGVSISDFEASSPFSQQASSFYKGQIVKQILEGNKKHIKTTTNTKIKPFKPGKRAGTVKSRTKSKPKKKIITVARRRKRRTQGVEKGTGKAANTSKVAELARLTAYINSRLPAEVRRNMGRPALINQTGRFSNSVQLISLTEAQKTIMAKYTYLLSPYATFENTGKKRWPLGYNPKTLIAKSIRNLAQGRIENKLTLRRV